MDDETQMLIERLHASPTSAVVAAAGAGAQAITWLLSVPGASRTVLEALVPYAPKALVEYLEYEPEQTVSVEVAKDMAHAAYTRAVALRQGAAPVVGIASTAAIATDRTRRGKDRCHVAAWSRYGVSTYSLEFLRGLRERRGEDTIVSRLILRALAEASDVEFCLPLELDGTERVITDVTRYEDPVTALLAEHVDSATIIYPDGMAVSDAPIRGGVLAGSFNPLHDGHKRLAAVASQSLDADVTFELSITNVDKPPLEEPEIRRRVAQFAGFGPVVITRAVVFYRKAQLFPGCTFIIGWDTAVRLVDPHYYDGDEYQMMAALDGIRTLDCRFLVAGRSEGGVFRTLDDAGIPERLKDMFTPIPESAFRYDLSSTELRTADDDATN